MLSAIQQHLRDIYQVDPGHSIMDFLVTDPALAKCLGGAALLPNTDETVLLVEDADGVSLSVYLDEQMLSRLGEEDPISHLKPAQLNDLWTVVEGVSHFNYLAFSAHRDKQVTLLELEIQAEVDKFVSTWLIALQQDEVELADQMHGWLFDEVSFRAQLNGEQVERYQAANDYAARFCHGLRQRLRQNSSTALAELRHFYRLTQGDKISHIHTQAWSA